MKKITKYLFLAASAIMLSAGCEKFLDKSPDLGLDDSDVFRNFESVRGYLDRCYLLLDQWNVSMVNGKSNNMTPFTATDECASTNNRNNFVVSTFNTGNWYSTKKNKDWEIGMSGDAVISQSYKGIRIANNIFQNIDRVQDMADDERNQILGQAYFYRAWFYYQLITRYGGMPKLDRVFMGDEDDDIPRMSYRDSHDWMMQDIENAIAMLPEMWDDANYSRPDKAAALGFKAQALLYAASPLMQNQIGYTEKKPYDKDLCLAAAKAAQECIEFINDNPECGRKFTQGTMEDYRSIFILPETTFSHEEYLWWDRTHTVSQHRTIRKYWMWADLDTFTDTDAAGFGMPTANIVAYYERKGPDGNYYPITDPKSGYVEGDWSSMQDRDPRFYNNLLLPGTEWGTKEGKPYYVTSWVGGDGYLNVTEVNPDSRDREFTGWLARKYVWPECNRWYKFPQMTNDGFFLHRIKSFYIRVTEMYLDYAEALFEATGDANSKPEGYAMTPAEAINIVRARVGVTPLTPEYTTPETFRESYRRERTVELMFENHRWEDIRRWMIFDEVFPTSNPIKNTVWTCVQGADADPAKENLTFTYKITDNKVEVRNYTIKHYWYPFTGEELGALDNLQQNYGW